MQELLPHGVRDAADAVEAEPRVRLDVRAVLARARGGGRGSRRAAPHARGAEAPQVERACRARAGAAAEGPRARGEGGERGDQALQDVALPVFWVSVAHTPAGGEEGGLTTRHRLYTFAEDTLGA